ncbi:Rv2175c family DNA-binding protein [Demequina sp. NBRC 110053]|uniref:Rv2175c family DNA-binding protein n=1 Tax=Demequina sp. NBRC 110053 TaxID=1570342 RepID=UPI000A06E798|nr:Rv2175c family DNA-binding protein [Demequina sp. NBRC 110053]
MSEWNEWLNVPDFADALGVTASDVREMIRLRQVIAVRRGPSDAWHLPAGFIEQREGGARVLATLPGTITMLSDAGLTDAESAEWLLSHNDELGVEPLVALREGRRAPVRRAAQTLF